MLAHHYKEYSNISGTLLEDNDLLELVAEWEKKERGSLPSYVEICIIVWQGVRNMNISHLQIFKYFGYDYDVWSIQIFYFKGSECEYKGYRDHQNVNRVI